MDTDMDEDSQFTEHEAMNVSIEPRITNRAHGGVRTDKTRFIRPVERQRMRPWLIDHLDQNDIPGLAWQERAEMIFRISWKHAANQCFNMQKDTNLFERWAIHTGRHQDSDHKRWKANFRCALNSLPDVTEMKEHGVKKGNNAFKVYRFLDEKEAKMSKDGKPRKKKEPPEYKEDSTQLKFKESLMMTYDSGEGTSSDSAGTHIPSLPKLHQLVPSGVDMLLEADNQEKLQPMVEINNLQEILAAATASLAAGGDAVALEKISIEQLSRLGEVSKMKLDIRQSDRKRRKKEVSGILNVFLCNWCEKVFPTKIDLFQHFLIIHQDKLLSGEEYGIRKHTQPTEKLQQEIEDLEKKVLGFTQESYQNESEEVIEDGQVVDMSSNNSMTSQDIYIEDQVLDLSVAGALAKHPQPQPDVALDLSMSTSKQKTGQKSATSKIVQKRRRSNASDGDYTNKFGNYGLAGAPRTKRQLSLLMKRKEEEEEKARKQAEAQHSMEDLVHAEILISLKSGSKDENETENMEVENGIEKAEMKEKNESIIKVETENVRKGVDAENVKIEVKGEKIDVKSEEVEEEVASLDNVIYLELNDGSKVAVCKQVENPDNDSEHTEDEIKSRNGIPLVVDNLEESENVSIKLSGQDDTDSSGKPYKCALCPMRFEDPTELLTHVSVHKTEYKCSVCTKVMTDKDVYLSHIESHLPAGKLGQICEVCNVHFSTIEELQKHVKSHETGTKLFRCGNCGKTYLTVKECVNCESCLQTKSKEKQAEQGNTKVPLVDKEVVAIEPDTITGGGNETVNEKGAAGDKETVLKELGTEKNDSLKEKIVNTGQKNLKGEPAINPVAGSDNLTGIIKSINTDGKVLDLGKEDNMTRKCSTQESFELPVDCLEDDSEDISQKNEKNDVVDGGRMQNNTKADFKAFTKKESLIKGINKNVLISELGEDKLKNISTKDVQYTLIKNESCTAEKEAPSDAKDYRLENFKTENMTEKDILQKDCLMQKRFESGKDRSMSKLSLKETIEDKIKKDVFHCGICDTKFHIDDVESHLKTHRPSKPGKSSKKELKIEGRTCVICKETIPLKSFYIHWKSHSLYDLSKAQNLQFPQKGQASKSGAGKGKSSFVCNLCSVKFTSFAELKLHVETHLRPRSFGDGSNVKKSDIVLSSKKTIYENKERRKKRKVYDEKRITGKRPKGKKVKFKGVDISTKKIEDYTKVKATPTITAALNSGPKYSLNSLTKGTALQNFSQFPPQLKSACNSSVTDVAQFAKADKGSLTVKDEEILKEGAMRLNVFKRKKTVPTLEALSPKKQKSINDQNDCMVHHNADSNDNKESNVNKDGACNQNTGFKQPQIIRSEYLDSVNVSSHEKALTAMNDKGIVGSDAKPTTLHRLQQKILLFKEGGVNVARPVLSPVPGTGFSPQDSLSTSIPVTYQTTTCVVKEQVLLVNNSSIGCALTQEAEKIDSVAAKTQIQPIVSVHVTNHSAIQGPNMGIYSVSRSTLPFAQASSGSKLVNSTVGLSASPQTYILSVSGASPINVVSGTPLAIPQSSVAYLPVSSLTNQILQAHSSAANADVSKANLTSTPQQVSLLGSLQTLTRLTTGVPVMSCNSKHTLASVSPINTVPFNISTNLNKPQHQLQSQFNSIKAMIGRASQPSSVNKPSLSPVLITQGGLKQVGPSTVKFPFSNIIYAPQTNSGNKTSDSLKATEDAKPSAYQLVLLPVSQPATQTVVKSSPIVSETVSKKAPSFHNLSLENTVLGAKLRANNIQASSQTRVDQNDSTILSSATRSLTSTSASVLFSPDTVYLMEKSQQSAQVSSNTAIPRSDGVNTAPSKSAVKFLAEKSDNVLCLTCLVCKQTLDNVEQMPTHVCKISSVSHSPNTSCSSDKLPGTTGSTEIKTYIEPRFIRRISPFQGTSATTNSPQTPITLSTYTSSSSSASNLRVISGVTMTSSSVTRDSGVASLVKDLPKSKPNKKSHLLTSPTQVLKSFKLPKKSYEISEHTQQKVREFVLKDLPKSKPNKKSHLMTSPTRVLKSFKSPKKLLEISEHTQQKVREFVLKTKLDTKAKHSDSGGSLEPEDANDILKTMHRKENLNIYCIDKDEISALGNIPKNIVQCTQSGQTLKSKTDGDEEHIIKLYPCIICNRTFTLESFRKHAEMHMAKANMAEKGVVSDKMDDKLTEENCIHEEFSNITESKVIESLRKNDVYRCSFCLITTNDEKTLSQHYTKCHPSMTNYLCPADNCAQIFLEVQDCDIHYAFKHQHECRFCLQRFRTYVEYQAHITQHYKNKTLKYFSCVKCRTQFSNKKAFYRHCRQVSNKCPDTFLEKHIFCFQCHCCSINFISKECLKLHFKRKFYHGVSFRCCVCREVIDKEADVDNHMSSHFPSCEEKQAFFCHTCCIIFPYKSAFQHHLSSADHNRAETLHQRLLDKYGQVPKSNNESAEVPAESTFEKRNNDDPNEMNPKQSKKRSDAQSNEKFGNLQPGKIYKVKLSQILYRCEQCNISFKSLFRLKQHRVIRHIKAQPAGKKLSYCGKTDVKSFLKRLTRKSIICEFCSKRFQHINDLRKHINLTHDEKVYLACKNPDCVMNFNSFFEYEVHACKSLQKGKDVGDFSCTVAHKGQPSLKSMKEYVLQYYVEDCKELLDKIAGTVEHVQEHLGDHFACQYCDKRLHSCEQLKFHLINQHKDKLAQCIDCLEYFFQHSSLLEHRRECAVKGFSDQDFHTKKKLLGCNVCFHSFLYILGLAKYLRDLKFLSDKCKLSGPKCFSRKGVFDLKLEGECGMEENSILPFYNSRKFVCISCKNEYCNAQDFYICMKLRLNTERNKLNEEESLKITSSDDTGENAVLGLDDEIMPLFEKSKVDLKKVFFCNECESIVCCQDDGICLASLKHPCSGSNTII